MASAKGGGVGTTVVVVFVEEEEFLFPDAEGDTVRTDAPAPLNVAPCPVEAAAGGLVAVLAPLKPGGGREPVPDPAALLLLLLLLFRDVGGVGEAAAARDCNGLLQAFCGGCGIAVVFLPLSVAMLLVVLWPVRTAVALLPLLLVVVFDEEEGFVRPLPLALLLLLLMMVDIQTNTNETKRNTFLLLSLLVCLFVW